VTHEQRISAYNRLHGTMAIVSEMIRLYEPEKVVLEELLAAFAAMKTAQENLGWGPRTKVTRSVQSGAETR